MGDKKSICFVPWEYPPEVGGVGTSAQRIVGYFQNAGYDIDVVTRDTSIHHGVRLEVDDSLGVRVFRTQELSETIDKLDREKEYDLFHGFFLSMAYPCLLVAQKRKKRPVIASIRGGELHAWQDLTHSKSMVSFVLKHSTHVTAPTSAHLQEAIKLLPDIQNKSSIILNSIKLDEVIQWTLKKENIGVVGTVGKFRSVKNLSLLLKAYSLVKKELRKGLLLVGDFSEPEERERIFSLAHRLNLDNEINLTGYVTRERIPEFLKTMRVFVLTSTYDTLPNTLLEAASIGVPIVTVDVAGVRELAKRRIDEGILIVSGKNEKALAENIENVLCDENVAMDQSRAASKMIKHLSPKEREAWLILYNDILK